MLHAYLSTISRPERVGVSGYCETRCRAMLRRITISTKNPLSSQALYVGGA